MSKKRKDAKGRILHNGESQRSDGRYMYKYTDVTGKTKYVYSWRLVRTDSIPSNGKNDVPLREKEKTILKDIEDDIIPNGDDLTVYDLVKKYVLQKNGVRHNTQAGYKTLLNLLSKDEFGNRRIDKVRLSDAKAWFIRLQKNGKGYSSIHAIRGIIKPAFRMAMEDDLIRKNPFDFELTSVVVNDSTTREAISNEEQEEFLNFVYHDAHFKRYYDGIYILFHTGLRISEFVGLTIEDLDFENEIIRVDHQLQRTRSGEYIIERTKTKSGVRYIPMTEGVKECFMRIVENRNHFMANEPVVDGMKGFLYLDKNGMPMLALHWEKYFQNIREKYKKLNGRELSVITPHVCRHTFCSNLAKKGMSPKALQTIMGHSEISITMNVYTHVQLEDLKKEMKKCTH